MKPVIMIHYSELGLKGGNRSLFERRLVEDLRRVVKGRADGVRLAHSRILAFLSPGANPRDLAAPLARVFGVAWYSFGYAVKPEEASITDAAEKLLRDDTGAKSFGLTVRRIDREFPIASDELCRRAGRRLQDATGLAVDLDDPDLRVGVEILPGEAFVLGARHEGARGLPRGSAGRLLCLFSGGIDSPVAAWHMMARGATVHLLHFHPYRTNQEVLETKMARLLGRMREFDPDTRLYLVPFDRYQAEAALGIPAEIETVFFRRYMWRTAELLARRERLEGLVTGDSLGQVASQTLTNLAAAQTGLSLPIFQPLIGLEKDVITKTARRIGTYEASLEPYKDCCSLVSRKAKTRVSAESIKALENRLDMDRLLADSLGAAAVQDGTGLHPLSEHRPSKYAKSL